MALVIAMAMVLGLMSVSAFADVVTNQSISITATVSAPAAGNATIGGNNVEFTDSSLTKNNISFTVTGSYDNSDAAAFKKLVKKLCKDSSSMTGYAPFVTVDSADAAAATASVTIEFLEAPGSITINSPVMGASYKAYQIFDLTMNDATNPDSFAYSIKTNSPFYTAVTTYAEQKENNALVNGMTLTASADNTLFIVTVDKDKFDAQKFGKYLEEKLNSTGSDKITVPEKFIFEPEYEDGQDQVTVDKSKAIDFENLLLGYYLITSEYVDPYSYVTLEYGTEGETGYQKWTFTKDSTTDDISTAAEEYANKVYPDDNAVKSYVSSHPDDFEKTWDAMTDTEKAAVKTQLINSTKQSAINLINEKIAASNSDDNTQPLTSRLVFVDSTTPHANVNEKNEVEKWDTPVNPQGHADLKDVPDHGEPEGGKNIIVREASGSTPAIYADWSEANIGDDVHYQLSINATNFERVEEKDTDGKTVMENGHAKFTVEPVKEYVIADYQNENMEFNASKKLSVRIVKKQADGTVETIGDPMDYTSWVTKGYFFTNNNKTAMNADADVFTTGSGIVIPWVEKVDANNVNNYKNVTKTEKFVLDSQNQKKPIWVKADADTPADYKDSEGNLLVDVQTDSGTTKQKVQAKDGQGNLLYETEVQYFASKYDNDVTILVDYYMTLKDTATIDNPGNTNTSQFGVNYLADNEVSYNPDSNQPDTPPTVAPLSPTEKKDKDNATVYTYALALHKVDENGKDLAGAKFKVKGLTATAKSDGWYKVGKLDTTAADFTSSTELVTDKDGNLVIEGLMTTQEVEIMETEAPAGYNKLAENIKAVSKKVSATVTTKSTVTYTDKGNITTEVSNTEIVYKDANDAQVAKKVTTAAETKYYLTDNSTTTSEDIFNNAITQYTGATKTDVTVSQLTPYEYKVVNKQGAELPSTGGIGTTIFYVVGAILVIGAGVVLITRRRMGS